ncbi:MAG TPA: tRNA (cytidine(34)-2'-O)-methyltransferase [Verrucomicrobiales bacterium]|nr:tRNA (cytidine(34)-2'-O)-methyltransferase [Verrucomicrobiales bacterium]
MHIVLVEPEIPPNTGNIARLCAVTGSVLHLIEPLGFELSDKYLKRAGMDYWQHLDWKVWSDWKTFSREKPSQGKIWYVESKGPKHYAEVEYGPDDFLVFGRETAGLPEDLYKSETEKWLRIPMFHAKTRSLNLGSCVALVLYEALRQQGFSAEI